MQETPWFPPETKPYRAGVYKTVVTPLGADGYSFWNGWRWTVTKSTVDEALVASFNGAVSNKHWKGLSYECWKGLRYE